MRKSYLPSILALTVAALAVTGCGKSESDNAPAAATAGPAAPSMAPEAPKAPAVKPAEGAAEPMKKADLAADDTKKAAAEGAMKSVDTAEEGAKSAAASLSADQQSYIETAKTKLADLKAKAEALIAEKRKDASPEVAKVLDSLESAIKNADESFADLQASGAKAWADKKPLVEAALKDLLAKFGEAKAKTALGGIEIPGMGK